MKVQSTVVKDIKFSLTKDSSENLSDRIGKRKAKAAEKDVKMLAKISQKPSTEISSSNTTSLSCLNDAQASLNTSLSFELDLISRRIMVKNEKIRVS